MTTLDDYDFDRVIGHGASGTVWRARQRGPVPRTVAVKRVRVGADDARRDRIRREAEILSTLDHPNIVGVLDVIEHRGEVAIVMPVADGGSLADRIAEAGALPVDDALDVLVAIADALGSAHRRGLLHRDVTPANVLFTSDGHPLLTDFGVAISHPASATAPAGTPGYLDPALLAGHPASPASDVYALAATAYHALAGRLPVDGEDDDALVAAAREGRVIPLAVAAPHVPASVASLIDGALAPDPGQRPSDAGVLQGQVRRAREAVPGVAATPRPTTPADRRAGGTIDFGVAPPSGGRLRSAPPRTHLDPSWSLLVALVLTSVLAVEIVVVPGDQLRELLMIQAPPAVAGAALVTWRSRSGRPVRRLREPARGGGAVGGCRRAWAASRPGSAG